MRIISRSQTGRQEARRCQGGSALLIVLAFVVLMAGLVLAFFSRSILEEQVSASSANQVKVDALALGAVSATISDLKQEMEEGSSVFYPVSGNNYIYYYIPTQGSTTGTYPSVVPAPTPGATTAYGPAFTLGLSGSPYANLIKVSLHGQKFYPTTAPYDSTETNPLRAAPVSTGTTGDSAAGTIATGSSDGTATNGRYISAARWTKPLFLPPNTPFPFPDWIYVQRTPALLSPTTFNANLVTAPNNMATTTTVVGRYAYAVYDEGGLLDINVAGMPTPVAPSAAVSASSSPVYSAYKDALAMADLTQIGLTQAQIDTIVGWRNNASAAQSQNTTTATPLSGYASSGYTWTGSSGYTSATNYWANVVSNPTGFLRPMSAWSTTPATLPQSDQFFTSRQQLIQFFNQILGGGSTVQSTLQYLTHFSRGLNQPSYMPAYNRPPVISTLATGGNDLGGGTEDNIGITVAKTGSFAKTTVNPSFLSARVTAQFTRNDGSIANVGDPLVKKRFALSRLAWLTYLGPIADDNGLLFNNASSGVYVGSTNATNAGNILTQLETTYGYSPAFLAQGGPTNIQKYFGLAWVQDSSTSIGINDGTFKWKYEHGANITSNGVAGNTTTPGIICTLGYAAAAGRDPDFFELLKASIAVGSIAKAGTLVSSTIIAGQQGTVTTPWGYQAQKDSSVDNAIIQIGANIIDQFDTDSYCTRILFDDGTWKVGGTPYPQEIRGVEDLPYLSRMRGVHIKLTDSSPAETLALQGQVATTPAPPATPTTTPTGYTSSTTGTGAFFQTPEIFDPFTWNPSGSVALRPTSFKLIPFSADPVNIGAGNKTSLSTTQPVAFSRNNGVNEGDAVADPGEPTAFTINGEAITFTIPATATGLSFFRESTLLNKPDLSGRATTEAGPPIGSSLIYSATGLPTGYTTAPVTSYYQAAAYTAVGVPSSISGITDNQKYLGFNFGTVPLWFPKTPATSFTAATPMVMTGAFNFNGNTYFTYQLQYLDPVGGSTYITYDEKFLPLSFSPPGGGGFGLNQGVNAFLSGGQNTVAYGSSGSTAVTGDPAGDPSHFDLIAEENSLALTDPRTSRFSSTVFNSGQTSGAFNPPPLNHKSPSWSQWIDASQNALMSVRPDYNVGWDSIAPPTALKFYNAGSVAVGTGSELGISGGLLSQNSMSGTYSANTLLSSISDQSTLGTSTAPQYYADSDGVVRRATAGYTGAPNSSATTYNGLPLQTATTYTAGTATPIASNSRPIMLNRPFHSVAELGYTFSGAPWKNIDFSMPESGFSALLDVFCINDTDDTNGLVAGKVNLNTRQAPVLNAILNGAYKDEFNNTGNLLTSADTALLTTSTTYGLTKRTAATTSPYGPLRNMGELVGKWISGSSTTVPIDGSASYSGFAGDINNIATTGTPSMAMVQRFHETAIRALSNTGQTRVWNLMIDVIAQTGRLPASATTLGTFYVEGEQRYWVHLAIDRFTGQILDQQIEVVKE